MTPICKDCNEEGKQVNGKWKCPKCGKELKERRMPKHPTPVSEKDDYSYDF